MSYVSEALKFINDGSRFTIATLATGINCNRERARVVVQQLTWSQSVEVVGLEGNFKKKVYRVTEFGRLRLAQGMFRNRPRDGAPREAMPAWVSFKLPPRPMPRIDIGRPYVPESTVSRAMRCVPSSVWALGAAHA